MRGRDENDRIARSGGIERAGLGKGAESRLFFFGIVIFSGLWNIPQMATQQLKDSHTL